MTDANISTHQLLEQQLAEAHEAQKKLLALVDVHQSQLRSVIECMHQLMQSCKGQDLHLDTRLTKLRSRLTTEGDISALLPELAELNNVLQGRSEQSKLDLKQSQKTMISLVRNLHAVDQLPAPVQRELTHLQHELTKPLYSVWEHLPRINRLASLYESMLLEKMVKGEPIPTSAKHHQLAHELAHLLNEMQFRPNDRDTIAAIKAELAGQITVEGLLQAYQQVLTMLSNELMREKNSSHQFLSTLNDCLGVVRSAASENWNLTLHSFAGQRDSNVKLSKQYTNMDKHVSNATELEALKAHIGEELMALRTMLKQRESEQQQDFIRIKQSMDSMRKELVTLSNEANGYKEKLVEQQRLNMVDTLTQLPNRAALDERLKREFRNVRRYGSSLWVAVTDIDHFKKVNDKYGHATGDKTLQIIAMALKNSLRKEEFVARYGGEEFVLLLPEVNQQQVLQILDRTRERICNIPFKFRQERLSITISIGAAQVGENETIQEAFERADAALYTAKNRGRNRVELDT